VTAKRQNDRVTCQYPPWRTPLTSSNLTRTQWITDLAGALGGRCRPFLARLRGSNLPCVAELADYLDLTVGQAREQFRVLAGRRPVHGGRQVTFMPVETLLCLAASFLVNHRHYGGTTAHQAPEPVPSLARLFSRPPSSVLAKMANLDGSRSHGGRWDVLAGAMLRDDPARFSRLYRVLLEAARAEGIGLTTLPDFLGLEYGGELALLGQEELDISVLEASLRDQLSRHGGGTLWSELETERILLAAVRVGQHVFAQQVLANCGSRCVFCGLRPAAFGAKRMLMAGHIKPWKDSTSSERLDPRNGLAACPAHDVAFDTRPPARQGRPNRPAGQAILRTAALARGAAPSRRRPGPRH
jgi:putative restriction endonuclease